MFLACGATIRSDTSLVEKEQTLALLRHPRIEIYGPTDQRVSYNPVLQPHVTNLRDSSAASRVNTLCDEPARVANRREQSPQTETDRPTRTTLRRYNLRLGQEPTRYSDHLVHQIGSTKTQLRPVKFRRHKDNKQRMATDIGKHPFASKDLGHTVS